MARVPNIEKLSYAELLELRDDVEGLIAQRAADEKANLKAELHAMAKERGFDLDEVMGGKSRKGGKVAVKYRDPNNPENTWTGRGRMPRWMAEATKKRGVTKENFEI